ncbi:Hint domain-containing protein [Ancylobacter defluvii]|uniref:Hedgehog/Intein (Hint) domain-containing protein n=1 Tax=Ancylobacter defluvii TaxID=1282440 RepID=A0A9W6JXT8_9HYPH|nr:Hint domain-containing protein [Ancylobacter defluvii]MBS7588946.1 Hint domain-containing protein [Ancylobacter defluvii]GLK84546.1 hypothetical protein GCM10017653_26160 [Ancylobacter defluvii]
MATYQTAYLYVLDENGNSNTGKIDEIVNNSEANSTESVDNSIVSVGETFSVVFTNTTTGSTYDGTYTYLGHATPFSGFVASDSDGVYYLFSNDPSIPVGTTLNGFTAEAIPVCFLAGTMIATPSGEVAIETLHAGDLVLTADGSTKPVRWLARQTVSTIFADPMKVCPIRITAGALGGDLPARDLCVSNDHALLIDGMLVQAGALVNGTTIMRHADMPQTFVYYHVELEDHSLILVEGVPAETYVDNVTRRRFDNWQEAPEASIAELDMPRVKSARQLPASIRARLAEREAA